MSFPRRQTRFHTAEQIIARIDKTKLWITEKNSQAIELEQQAQATAKEIARIEEAIDRCILEDTASKLDELWEQHKQAKNLFHKCREEAMKCRKRAKSLEENTLPRLARSLAAFNTGPMEPICKGDPSVIYER